MGSDLDRYLSKRTRRGLLGLDWHPIAKSAFLPLMDHSFAFVAFEATDFPLTHALSYAHKTPLGSTITNSRMPQGLSSGGSTLISYLFFKS